MKNKRAKIVNKCMRTVWSSLESHLQWCHGKEVAGNGDRKFHKDTVREYCSLLKHLSKLY